MRYSTRQLSMIIIFSSLGAVLSVPIGYAGNYMKAVPVLPLGIGQALSGLHLVTVVLASLLVPRRGTAVVTATLKGLLEAVLFSFHGLPVILISSAQGLVIDTALSLAGYDSTLALCLGCGLASASNVAFLQYVLLMPFLPEVFTFMYVVAFISGAALGGLLSLKLYHMVGSRVSAL